MFYDTLSFIDGFGPTQVLVVLVIVLVLFGGSRIKDVMGGLGSGLKEFKKGMKEEVEEDSDKTAKS